MHQVHLDATKNLLVWQDGLLAGYELPPYKIRQHSLHIKI